MNEPAPLPDDLLAYLDAAREPEPTPPATKERLLARLGPFLPPTGGGGTPTDGGGGDASPGSLDGGAALGSGGAGASGATAASSAAAGSTAAAGATAAIGHGKWIIATVSALLGAGGGAAMHATFAPERTVTVVVSAPVAAGTSVAPLVVSPSASAEASAEAPPSATLAASAPTSAGEPAAPRKSSLRAERILLEAANAALMRGDHAAALASLRQHARTYPKGDLAQERELLMAQATRLQQPDKGSAPR